MTMKLQAKGNNGKGEIFQRVVFGRTETSEIKDFFLRQIQENVDGWESLWTDNERRDNGISISHNKNLTDGRDHPSRNDAGDKPVERLGSSFHDELQMLPSEGTIFEKFLLFHCFLLLVISWSYLYETHLQDIENHRYPINYNS